MIDTVLETPRVRKPGNERLSVKPPRVALQQRFPHLRNEAHGAIGTVGALEVADINLEQNDQYARSNASEMHEYSNLEGLISLEVIIIVNNQPAFKRKKNEPAY